MLLGTVLLWSLNITVTKYMFEHGWKPLAYGTIRYFMAIVLFWGFTYYRERSFRIARGDIWLVLLAALMIFLNQLCFVYSIKLAHASTVALLLGTTPIFIGLISLAGFNMRNDCCIRSGGMSVLSFTVPGKALRQACSMGSVSFQA